MACHLFEGDWVIITHITEAMRQLGVREGRIAKVLEIGAKTVLVDLKEQAERIPKAFLRKISITAVLSENDLFVVFEHVADGPTAGDTVQFLGPASTPRSARFCDAQGKEYVIPFSNLMREEGESDLVLPVG